MKRCEKNVESLRQTPEKQQEQQQERLQKQQQGQQQTIAEEQLHPFLQPTTPVWGDRMVSNRATPLRLSFISLLLSSFPQYASCILFILSGPRPLLYSTKCRRWKSYIDVMINRVFEVQT